MKANPRSRAPRFRSLPLPFPLAALSSSLLAALLTACVPPPPTTPAPRQTAAPYPAARPVPAAPAPADWRDAPITPGDWTYAANPAGSAASFANGLVTLRCDLRSHAVTLTRAAAPSGRPASLGVTTSDTTRTLAAQASPAGLAATLSGRDRLLDSMAFSRGRFAVATAGEPTLYVPSWSEVSRVVEDCR